MATGFGNWTNSTKAHEVIKQIAANEVNRLRPATRLAEVITIDSENRTVNVKFVGETNEVTVPFTSQEPANPGQWVRIGGTTHDRYVQDVLGSTAQKRQLVATTDIASGAQTAAEAAQEAANLAQEAADAAAATAGAAQGTAEEANSAAEAAANAADQAVIDANAASDLAYQAQQDALDAYDIASYWEAECVVASADIQIGVNELLIGLCQNVPVGKTRVITNIHYAFSSKPGTMTIEMRKWNANGTSFSTIHTATISATTTRVNYPVSLTVLDKERVFWYVTASSTTATVLQALLFGAIT